MTWVRTAARRIVSHGIVACLVAVVLGVAAPALASSRVLDLSALGRLLPSSLLTVDNGAKDEPVEPPAVYAAISPSLPDGFFGWRVTPTTVTLFADRPANLYYRWNDLDGPWLPYQGPLLAPEGKNRLFAFAESDGVIGPTMSLLLKVDYESPKLKSLVAPTASAESTRLTDSGTVVVRAYVNPWAGPKVVRLAGPDRYGTSQQISQADFTTASTILFARGDKFPDALASAGLAGVYRAPILLVKPRSVPKGVAAEVQRLGATRAFVIGGTGAISESVAKQIAHMGLRVERIGGKDRYDTASLIARRIVSAGGTKSKVYVARGDMYPDSLAVSPAAYSGKVPIVLVHPSVLPAPAKKVLGELKPQNVVVAGGTAAVSSSVASSVRSSTGGGTVRRIGGKDRYETAGLVADDTGETDPGAWHLIGLATGQNFPDGLCGGAGIGEKYGLIMLTPGKRLSPQVAERLRSHGDILREVHVLGGEGAVSASVWEAVLTSVR